MKVLISILVLMTSIQAIGADNPNGPGASAYDGTFEANSRQKDILNMALDGEGSVYSTFEFQSEYNNVNGCPLTIRYVRFGNDVTKKGAIAFSTGFTEPALKYTELADDLLKKGYGPIYIINHRGQGNSDRVLVPESEQSCDVQAETNKDTPQKEIRHKGFVDNFKHYTGDFDQFVKTILEEDGPVGIGIVNPDKFFLLAHSMGGAVALAYIMNHQNPFEKVILSSPMLRVLLPEQKILGIGMGTGRFNNWVSHTGSNPMEWFGVFEWTDYAREAERLSPVWSRNKRPFGSDSFFGGTPVNGSTSDPNRHWFHVNLLNYHPDDMAINGPTVGWVHEALDGTENMIWSPIRSGKGVYDFLRINKINLETHNPKDMRIKIFQASADKAVINSGQDDVCNRFNEVLEAPYFKLQKSKYASVEMCSLIKEGFVGAEHELFIESNLYRDHAIKLLTEHFQ